MYVYIYVHMYIYTYIYISVLYPEFFLCIPVHASNVYFCKTKGLKGPHHSWKLFQKMFYNLEYLD